MTTTKTKPAVAKPSKSKPAGSGKTTLAPALAGYGPLLLGRTTKVTPPPEVAVAGEGASCVTARSVPALTVTLAIGAKTFLAIPGFVLCVTLLVRIVRQPGPLFQQPVWSVVV